MNDYIWLAKRGKIYFISMARDNNKCYVKFVFWKVFKNFKTINESISRNLSKHFN